MIWIRAIPICAVIARQRPKSCVRLPGYRFSLSPNGSNRRDSRLTIIRIYPTRATAAGTRSAIKSCASLAAPVWRARFGSCSLKSRQQPNRRGSATAAAFTAAKIEWNLLAAASEKEIFVFIKVMIKWLRYKSWTKLSQIFHRNALKRNR